ncbi:MAG: N-methyl-L-tryptophan oxidase [Planctomycetes bacterium]|nr:N-methyl-L-tryptophan oxidase [Planctomycetota bacterium]
MVSLGRRDVVIIGAGVHGLATAWQLARRGVRSVTILEQFEVGHARGSSHGAARITRSSYASLVYAQMMRTARLEEWPALEKDAGEQLIHPCEGCFFGPEKGPFAEYLAVAERLDRTEVERLDRATAQQRFPMFRFEEGDACLIDRTAGVVAADRTVAALARLAAAGGVEILTSTRVLAIDRSRDPMDVHTNRGRLETEKLILTVGPWIGALVPEIALATTPIRQSVGYFELDGAPQSMELPQFPVWVYSEPGPNGLWYGLPAFGTSGVKAAQHRTAGRRDDPDDEAAASEAELAHIEAFLGRRIRWAVKRRVSAETCFYTMTANEDYILAQHPGDPRVTIGAGFSGHGFKLAPVSGRILAELALDGRSTVSAYEQHRAQFQIQK